MSRPKRSLTITPDIVLKAYACGVFPMARHADDPTLFWVQPNDRGIIPLDAFHVPRRLARTVRQDRFEVSVDRDFEAVIEGCASGGLGPDRDDTWINAEIRHLFDELFRMGHVHTVECRRDGTLVGGLYGVRLGRAFFGESMFTRARDASKVALVHLVARLRAGGFALLDTQFLTEHLARFGAVEMSQDAYEAELDLALSGQANFYPFKTEPLHGRQALAALQV